MIELIRAGRPRHLAEQAKEILRGLARELIERNAAGLGQDLGGLDHIGRLVALAAETAGRGTLPNRRKKFSEVWRAISSSATPRVSAKTFAVSTT